MCVGIWAQLGVHLLQAVLSHCRWKFVQSTQLSGCAEWGGEGDVDQGVFARAYLEDHQSRAELGPMPASTGCPDGNWKCSGEWLGPGEGLPLIGVLVDVESGDWVGAGPIIQHHSTRRWLLGCALD